MVAWPRPPMCCLNRAELGKLSYKITGVDLLSPVPSTELHPTDDVCPIDTTTPCAPLPVLGVFKLSKATAGKKELTHSCVLFRHQAGGVEIVMFC